MNQLAAGFSRMFNKNDNSKENDDDQREGFICPQCLLELDSPELLISHVAEHSEGIDNQNEEMELLKMQIKVLEESKVLLGRECMTLKERSAERDDELRSAKEDYVLLRDELVKVQTLMNEAIKEKENTNQWEQKMAEFNRLFSEKERQLTLNDQKLREYSETIELLNREIKEQNNSIETRLLQSNAERSSLVKERDSLNTKLQMSDSTVNELKADIESAKSRDSALNQHIDSLEHQLSQLKSLNDSLEERLKLNESARNELLSKGTTDSAMAAQLIQCERIRDDLQHEKRQLLSRITDKDVVINDQNSHIELISVQLKENDFVKQKLENELILMNEKLKESFDENRQLQNDLEKVKNDTNQQMIDHRKQLDDREMRFNELRRESSEEQKRMALELDSLRQQLSCSGALHRQFEEKLKQMETDDECLRKELECEQQKCHTKTQELNDVISQITEKSRTELNDQKVQFQRELSDEKSLHESRVSLLNETVNDLMQRSDHLKASMTLEKNQLEERIQCRDKEICQLSAQKEQLLLEMASHDELIAAQNIKITSLETKLSVACEEIKRIREENREIESTVTVKTKEIDNLRNEMTIREEENGKLQSDCETLNERLTKCENENCELRMSVEKYRNQLSDSERAKVESQRSAEKDAERIKTLNAEMVTFRAAVEKEKSKTEAVQSKMDEIIGQKLEIDAKLSNLAEEKRALIDRCISGEEQCERLKDEAITLRRRLDDAEAALHELGRENVSLQVEANRKGNRKWADDESVKSCTKCAKTFSVTIRKHHCRNCGQIYCNDCSAHTETVPLYPKPVRVCDNCHKEIQNKLTSFEFNNLSKQKPKQL